MSIVAAPLHRPASYPKVTGYSCPVDGAPVVIDQWTHTTADHEGAPHEDTGLGFYCTNKSCTHSVNPIDEEDMAHILITEEPQVIRRETYGDLFEELKNKNQREILGKFEIPPYQFQPKA